MITEDILTKYILNSGGVRANPDKSNDFFNEIVKGIGSNPKILFCFFAEKRENWEAKFEKYKEGFISKMPEDVKPEIELAFPDIFEDQLMKNDAVYIHGGDDHLVQYWLRQFDLPKAWEGKVVAATSAGSSALCAASWTLDWRKPIDGLGILTIKFIPHYKSTAYSAADPRGPIDWSKAYQELAEYGDKSMMIYALEEGDFQTFEV